MNHSILRYRNDIQLLISIPSSGRKGEWLLMKWLWYTCMNAPFYIAWNTFEGRPEDDTRNGIVQHFLKNPTDNFSFRPRPKQLHYTHLMMIDDDILPPPNTFEMVLHDKSVISTVVFTWREGAPLALIMKWDEENQGYRQDHDAINKLNQGERLVKVDASGTGCFVVKREVYENLVSNWFRFQYDETGRCSLSEDFYFYQRLREIGYSPWIDGAVVCGHIGSVNIQEIQNLLVRSPKNEVDKVHAKET